MKYAIIGVAVASVITGCHSSARVQMPGDTNGYVKFEGDAKGVQAFMDGQNALITNGKASADQATDAWSHRKLQEKEVTARETAPGTLESLFGGSK